MSLGYSSTTNKNGILQRIESEVGFNDGEITGDSTALKIWTASVNLALDRVYALIFGADGTWQFDDSNHTDYPIITTNLVDGQRDYSFTTDGNSNLILDIYKVLVKDSATSTTFSEIYPKDAQSEGGTQGFWDGVNVEGVPSLYDKTANGIFLDPIPSYNSTNGLKIYINREASYFATSDTTKKPGFAGLFHEYLVLEPAYRYARANSLTNREVLKRDVLEMEKAITEYYSRREKDVRKIMKPQITPFI